MASLPDDAPRVVYLSDFARPWHTEVHVARELGRLGYRVECMVQPARCDASTLDELERAARDEGAALVLWTRVHPLPGQATQLWRRLEADGIATASYHLDLYRGLSREPTFGRGIVPDPFWTTGTVFTADGDPQTQAWLEAHGVHHVWMPAAVVSDETYPGRARPGMRHAVTFVGSVHGYPAEWPWRRRLVEGLQEHYGDRFGLYPRGAALRGQALNDLFASSTVVVGDSLCPPGHRNYWSDRFYETVGRGGFLVGPNVPGIETHFTAGEHLDLYELENLDDVIARVDYWLAHPTTAREIARQGLAHVQEHHTYRHRMLTMLAELGLPVPSEVSA